MLRHQQASSDQVNGHEVRDLAGILARGYLRLVRLTEKRRNVAYSCRKETQIPLDSGSKESPDRVQETV